MSTFKYVINKAGKETPTWSNKNKLTFLYFNSNGLYQQYNRLYCELLERVKAGEFKTGYLLAYNADYYEDLMRELNDRKRIKPGELYALKCGFKSAIEKLSQILNA